MMRINRQQVPTIVLIALAGLAMIVTWMLFSSVWSSLRLSSRMSEVNLRLATPDESVAIDDASDQTEQNATSNSQPDAPDQPDNTTVDNKPQQDKPGNKKPDPPALAVARIKTKNMFIVPEKPDFRNILGILGDSVLYPGGISLKVGDQHNGATIKEVGSNWVKVEYEGEIIPLGVYGGTPPPEEDSDKKDENEPGSKASTQSQQPDTAESVPAESSKAESPRESNSKTTETK